MDSANGKRDKKYSTAQRLCNRWPAISRQYCLEPFHGALSRTAVPLWRHFLLSLCRVLLKSRNWNLNPINFSSLNIQFFDFGVSFFKLKFKLSEPYKFQFQEVDSVLLLGHFVYRVFTYSHSCKTVNTRENFWNVYCFATNQMPHETVKDPRQTAAWISHDTRNNKSGFSVLVICLSFRFGQWKHLLCMHTWKWKPKWDFAWK